MKPTVLIFAAIAAPTLFAQPAANRTPPHIAYLYPAGGQHGTTFTVSVGGQNLTGADRVHVSGAPVSAKVVGFDRPLTQRELNEVREELQTLQRKRAAASGKDRPADDERERKGGAKRTEAAGEPPSMVPSGPWTIEDTNRVRELRELMARRGNRQINPALADTVTLEVTLPPGIADDECELRIQTPAGLSNPLPFKIGSLAESAGAVVTPTSSRPENLPRPRGEPKAAPPVARKIVPTPFTAPATLNGQILSGEIDRYRFTAKQGEAYRVTVHARSLIPFLADAVPGWFQATLGIMDSNGHEVAYDDTDPGRLDPAIAFKAPRDDEYTIEIKDSIFRGREDFVYRIDVTRLDSQTGPRRRDPAATPTRAEVGSYPRCDEVEGNDSAASAQSVPFPTEISGVIGDPSDADVYRISARPGTTVVAEVFARRLGFTTDSILTVLGSSGQMLAHNDDHEDKSTGLATHHADSRVMLSTPDDGILYIRVADTQGRGGDAQRYLLRLAPPRPGFDVRISPSVVNLRSGTQAPITAYALRRDGFDGEILLSLNGPRGLALSGARIPAGQDKVPLTLHVPAQTEPGLSSVTVQASATIAGRKVTQPAIPAEDLMQAFAYHHLVPAREFLVNVTGRGWTGVRLLSRERLQLKHGETVTLDFAVNARGAENISAELLNAPEGLSIKRTTATTAGYQVLIASDPQKTKHGLAGNLIVNVYGQRENAAPKKGPQRNQRQPLGTLPAVPFQVVD